MTAYSFKKRFVEPIRVGLGITLKSLADLPPPDKPYPKRQTIRAVGLRRHARPGETLQLYCGMRTKGCFLIGTARCRDVQPIDLFFETEDRVDFVEIGEYQTPGWSQFGSPEELDNFAREDGFANWSDMSQFWCEEHPEDRIFKGVLIRWEPLT